MYNFYIAILFWSVKHQVFQGNIWSLMMGNCHEVANSTTSTALNIFNFRFAVLVSFGIDVITSLSSTYVELIIVLRLRSDNWLSESYVWSGFLGKSKYKNMYTNTKSSGCFCIKTPSTFPPLILSLTSFCTYWILLLQKHAMCLSSRIIPLQSSCFRFQFALCIFDYHREGHWNICFYVVNYYYPCYSWRNRLKKDCERFTRHMYLKYTDIFHFQWKLQQVGSKHFTKGKTSDLVSHFCSFCF